MNGVPLTSGHAEAPAAGNAGREASGAYRPRYELVAEQILQLIGERGLHPGDRMPTEKDLATRLGTSRTVVREAVKILSATGRVSAQKGRGLYVADGESMLGARRWGGFFVPTNLDHIFMLFEFRRLQEMQASRLAARRASPSELRVIEAAVQTCRHGYTSGNNAEFDQGDDAFHLGVAAASHNFFLVSAVREARMLQRQASVIGLRGVGGHADAAVDEHDAIYRAIRDGEPEAAAQATSVHLDNTLEDYRREIQRRVFGLRPRPGTRRRTPHRRTSHSDERDCGIRHFRRPRCHVAAARWIRRHEPGPLAGYWPASMTMRQIPLGRTGLRVSEMVFGGAPIGGLFAPVSDDQAAAALEAAWTAGIRAFDTAPHYGVGLSEERIGRFLAGRPRAEFALSTKVGRWLVPAAGDIEGAEGFHGTPKLARVRDYSRDGTLATLEGSLRRLGIDRIDMALIHDPDDYAEKALDGAYAALDQLRSEGTIRAVGVGMNQTPLLEWFVERADLDCVLVAGRYSLLDTSAAHGLFPACQRRSVAVLAAGVFNSGILADPRPGATYDYAPAPAALLDQAQRIRVVCARYGVSIGAAAIRFVLRHPAVTAVIIGVRDAAEVIEDVTNLTTALPAELFDELAAEHLIPIAADRS